MLYTPSYNIQVVNNEEGGAVGNRSVQMVEFVRKAFVHSLRRNLWVKRTP